MRHVLLAWAAVSLLGACSTRFAEQVDSGRERNEVDAEKLKPEASVTLPDYPRDADLIEFFHGPLGSHRYFIDAKALSVGADGIVRYTAVVKTSGGATNVAYEGIRCKTEEKRIYAVGQPGQKWIQAKRSNWEPIRSFRATEYQVTLQKDFFCPDRFVVRDRETALRALRAGLHGSATRPRVE